MPLPRPLIRRPSGILLAVGLALSGAFGLTTSNTADAKATYESRYGFERTWNAALRLVRVDLGYKVTEKDEGGGYLLFEYRSPESTKATSGSIELVRGGEPEAPVRVVVQLPEMPHYHEQVLADALAAKMRSEYGEPPAIRKAPVMPPLDGGTDATTP